MTRSPFAARALVAAALVTTVPTCAQHPALTVGIAGGAIGLASCEIQGSSQSACGIITAAVAVGLGGLAWLVTTFADTNAHQLPSDDEVLPDGAVRVHTHTDLPPVPLDAGVIDAAPALAPAPVDAMPVAVPPAPAAPSDAGAPVAPVGDAGVTPVPADAAR